MRPVEEQALRDRTAAVVMDWAKNRDPPITGETPGDFADAIVAAHVVADESRLGLHRWIDAARRSGMSWADIGGALGISKQAAQQRFRTTADADADAFAEGEQVVRLGATAFNEMRMLRAEGERCNELMGTGALTLSFRRSDHRWEYRRMIAMSAGQAAALMTGDGWIYVSSWFPFHYFKRPRPD